MLSFLLNMCMLCRAITATKGSGTWSADGPQAGIICELTFVDFLRSLLTFNCCRSGEPVIEGAAAGEAQPRAGILFRTCIPIIVFWFVCSPFFLVGVVPFRGILFLGFSKPAYPL